MLLAILPLFLACNSDKEDTTSLTLSAAVAEHVPTVLVAEWTPMADASAAQLRYRSEGEESWTSVDVDPAEGRAIAVGFKPQTAVELELAVTTAEGEQLSGTASATTDALSSDLPAFTVDVAQDGALDGGLLLTTNVQSPSAVLIFDGDGDVVWSRVLDGDAWAGRARRSDDGQLIYVMPADNDTDNKDAITVLDLEGKVVDTVAISDAHHDFTVLPDGTVASLVYDIDTSDPTNPVQGDAIKELSPDGTETTIWSVFDSFEYVAEEDVIEGAGWSHANSIEYDAELDRYTVSFLGLRSIVSVERATGEVAWIFGGTHSDWQDQRGTQDLLLLQHGFEVLDGSLLIFENGPSSDASSSAVEFSLDMESDITEPLWQYEADPGIYTPSLGSVHRLGSGNTVINYATGGRLVEAAPDGVEVYQVSADLGGAMGYSVWLPSF